MQTSVIRAAMDSTLGEAMTLCFQHRIRHLPVINDEGKLVGLLTDRDLRFYISHRLGTIMENNSDREALHHHLHVIMVRRVVSGRPEMTITQATRLMLDNRIGCLPIIDGESRLVGIVTTGDFLRLIAEEDITAAGPRTVPVQSGPIMP
jgi:acetoin utilization protein AcuB